MSYGPGPTSVGTLFMNANNNTASLRLDSTNTPGGCNPCLGDGSGGGGDGGGTGGGGTCDSCGCGPVIDRLILPLSGSAGNGNSVVTADNLPVIRPIKPGFPFFPGPGDMCKHWDRIILPLGKPCQDGSVDAPTGLDAFCVSPESRIALFPEGCLAAAEVQSGDLLKTRRADGTLAGEVVTAVRRSNQAGLLLETKAGHRLHCSLSHEIMVADPTLPQGRRRVASELTMEDRLLQEDGTPVALRKITPQADGPVIQISLSGPEHLYLSEGLWSHNKIGIAWPVPPPDGHD